MQAVRLSYRRPCTTPLLRKSNGCDRLTGRSRAYSLLALQQRQHEARLMASAWRRRLSQTMIHQATTNNQTSIEVKTSTGTTVHHIQRSYPKGKAEKLTTGLQQLLSPQSQITEPGYPKSRLIDYTWTLSPHGDAIHRTFTIALQTHIDALVQIIDREAETLAHHPHITFTRPNQANPNCHVCAITCTTHNPHGLSLKDVKLALKIDRAINDLDGRFPGSIGPADGGVAGPVAQKLMLQNEDAAAAARRNPESMCAIGAGKGSGS